jgi:cystathionine beta-synthase
MVHDSILNTIGNTPLIKLKKSTHGLKCNIYAKCEFFNPGGSVKDRIALQMVENAERQGVIKPGDTLIEPTSGNTGIGLALVGAIKGYQVIITMPEKMSQEKQVVLESLGARIIRTPTEAAWDHPDSHIQVANKLVKELPNAHILDQYKNLSNPEAHYKTTAQEILNSLENKVDMIVVGAGTGGTITGIAQKIKEVKPKCKIVGADPFGSILAGGDEVFNYKVEGIGYDFIPEVLKKNLVDQWVKTADRQSFLLARRLISKEGLLCGGSSGAVLSAALQAAQGLGEDQNCVIILADGVRNYLSKFVNNKWMSDNSFYSKESSITTKDFLDTQDKVNITTLKSNDSLRSAIKIMKEKGYSQLPVITENTLCGILKEQDILDFLVGGHPNDTTISEVMDKNVITAKTNTPIQRIKDMLVNISNVVIINESKKPISIITKIDIVHWMLKNG